MPVRPVPAARPRSCAGGDGEPRARAIPASQAERELWREGRVGGAWRKLAERCGCRSAGLVPRSCGRAPVSGAGPGGRPQAPVCRAGLSGRAWGQLRRCRVGLIGSLNVL